MAEWRIRRRERCPPWQVVTLGEGGVGKTSLIMRYVYDVFSGVQQTTIGSSFVERNVVVGDASYKLRLWDTAGQVIAGQRVLKM